MGDDDSVPLAACYFGGEKLATFSCQVLFGSDEELRVGVESHELAGELLKEVVWDHIHRLFDEASLLHFHACGRHREGLARADRMGQERVTGTHSAPDSVVLVGPKLDGLVHAGVVEVGAVEQAGTKV